MRDSSPIIPVGLVGCGEIARRYASALARGNQSGMRLMCVTDASIQAGVAFAQEFDVPFIPAFDTLLAQPLCLVCICTPNDTHAQLARLVLEAEKNVVLEHPMATNLDDAEALEETAKRAGKKLFIVRQRRFLRSIQLLRAILREGLLGKVVEVEMRLCWSRTSAYFNERPWRMRREGGGVVMNQASHFLDILLYLFGNPLSMRGYLGNIRHDIGREDSAVGILNFKGVRVFIECTIGAPDGCNTSRLRIKGSLADLELGGYAWEIFNSQMPAEFGRLEGKIVPPATGDHAGFLKRVARSLVKGDCETVDGAEGLRAVRLIDQIHTNFSRADNQLKAHFSRVFDEEFKLDQIITLASGERSSRIPQSKAIESWNRGPGKSCLPG